MLQNLTTKKGATVATKDLLVTLQEAKTSNKLAIKFIDGKATLVFSENTKGKLEGIAASVIYRMLLSKFKLQMSEAYELAAYLSEQLGGNQLPPKAETKAIPVSVNAELFAFKKEIAEKLSAISSKNTKKEMLEVLAQLQALTK